MNKGQFQTTLS